MAQDVPEPQTDPRIHVDAAHLRALGAKARGITLLPRQPARSVLNGRHASRLRGRGLNFEELRDYLPGDDVRSIDWKVTARTGKPHVRVYTEERDRPALFVVDQRINMFFGSQVYMKSVIAAEAAAIGAQCVLAQGDRIGGLVFGDTHMAEHRPLRRPAALTRFLASLAEANGLLNADTPPQVPLALNTVLTATARIAKTNSLICVFSDFDTVDADSERLIRRLSQHNDLILFQIADPLAETVPEGLRLAVSDGRMQAELDFDAPGLRDRVGAAMEGRLADLLLWSRRYGCPLVRLTTDRPALTQMQALFGHGGGL